MSDTSSGIKLVPMVKGNQVYDKKNRLLILKQAEPFTVTTEQYANQPEPPRKSKGGSEDNSGLYDKEMKWVWKIISSLDSIDGQTHNKSFAPGLPRDGKVIHFPKMLEGGGLVWLEAFKGDLPTNVTANGLFVCALGKPEILGAEWRSIRNETVNGKPVTVAGDIINGKEVRFGQTVILNIYTQGLYLQNLQVQLQDSDQASDNDDLPAYERSNGVPIDKIDTEDTPAKTYKSLKRTVDYYEFKGAEVVASADAVSKIKNNTSQLEGDTKPYAQCIQLQVYIDPFWKFDGYELFSKSLKIFPTITGDKVPKAIFESTFIKVTDSDNTEKSQLSNVGNKPVLTKDVSMNVGDFQLCRYEAIVANIPEEKNASGQVVKGGPIYLFNAKSDNADDKRLKDLEIVTGESNNVKKITIKLEDLNNQESDCIDDPKHMGHTLTLIEYPETSSNGYGSKPKEKKSVTVSVNSKGGVGTGTGASRKGEVFGPSTALNVYTPEGSDSEISFDARYIYNRTPLQLPLATGFLELPYAFRYFWLGSNVAGKPYVVMAATCRYEQSVKIIPYPDIEWKLEVNFNKFEEGESAGKKLELASNSIQSRPQHRSNMNRMKWSSIGEKKWGVALSAKWDGGSEVEFSEEFKKNLEQKFKAIKGFIEFMEAFFSPKNEQGDRDPDAEQTLQSYSRNQSSEIQKREREEREMQTKIRHLESAKDRYRNAAPGSREQRDARKDMESIQRSTQRRLDGLTKRTVVGFDLYWPAFEGSFNWKLVNTNDNQPKEYRNRVGVLLSGSIGFSPLLGASIYLDFLALAQRMHPVAFAVIAIADLSLSLIGDGSKIVCELRVTGNIGGTLDGFINTLTKENSFNKKDREANDKAVATVTGDVSVSLKVQIKLAKKKHLVFVSIQGSLSAEASATAKWKSRAAVDADSKGFYANIYGNFDGLVVIGKGSASGSISIDKDEEPDVASGSVGGTVTWQAIDKKEEALITTWRLGSL